MIDHLEPGVAAGSGGGEAMKERALSPYPRAAAIALAAPIHPNKAGMQGAAAALVAATH
jgi:hypothetical protein